METIEDKLQDVLDAFSLGRITERIKLDGGIVNNSFNVQTNYGRFVAQRLSPIFNEKVIEDYCSVQSYLRTKDIRVPVLLKRNNGLSHYEDSSFLWRVFEYIPHDCTYLVNEESIFSAGETIARFHRIMSETNFRPKFRLAHFHDTPYILNKMRKVIQNPKYSQEKKDKVSQEYNEIEKKVIDLLKLERQAKTIIHGDPKLNNFLFRNNRVIALLDLDTMMFSTPEIDVGDALRSCSKDENMQLRPERFMAFLEGYNSETENTITPDVAKKFTSLITLELSARFLTDYFELNYFNYNPKKGTNEEQNLASCRKYMKYYQALQTL